MASVDVLFDLHIFNLKKKFCSTLLGFIPKPSSLTRLPSKAIDVFLPMKNKHFTVSF